MLNNSKIFIAACLACLIFSVPALGQSVENRLEIAKEYGNAGLHDKAIEILVPIAVEGDSRAQMLLGSVYISKRNENDYMRGHSWVAKAAQSGEVEASMLLWSTLNLNPEYNNYNPHGENLGQLLREQYSRSLLYIAAEVSDDPFLSQLLERSGKTSLSRGELTKGELAEADQIAALCIETGYEECPPVDVFIRR